MQINGRQIANKIREDLKIDVENLVGQYGMPPGLATVLVGEDPASQTYIRNKHRVCAQLGIASFRYDLPTDASQKEVEDIIDNLNARDDVHGILVQLPLPAHLDEPSILDRINFAKDVDGLHPMNVGLLAMRGRTPTSLPCTPSGVIEMLKASDIDPEGKTAVVIGRSNIVGLPMATLLQQANATVTIAHSRTANLPVLCRSADILVAAIGKPEMVQADWVKDGAVVIDVGINRVDDATSERGYRLVGDVDTKGVEKVASAITPVPGGVGPMTIAMLMVNTYRAAKAIFEAKQS